MVVMKMKITVISTLNTEKLGSKLMQVMSL